MLDSLAIVVPVYNSEANLPELVERLEPVLRGLAERFELVLVDDGSRDGSWSVVLELTAAHEWIRAIRLKRNYGQHNALLCGVRAVESEVIVTMDDDLQHPPEELPRLLAELGPEVDVVYGPPQKEQHGLFRDLASKMTKLALRKAMGAETASQVSALRAFRTHVREAFSGYRGQFVSIDVLLTWGTTRFAAVTIPHEPRRRGESNYTLKKLLVHAINMMTGFSTFPLQIASLVGFFFTLFGIAVLLYVVLSYLIRGTEVPGFPFLASVIALFSGAQLFALGIMGEYLARMHFRSMDTPSYSLRESVPAAPTSEGSAERDDRLA